MAALVLLLILVAGCGERSLEGVEQTEIQGLAEQGDASAQYNLGVMYHNGAGVP